MVFCRGCGKEIHETAPFCPHCGAPQVQAQTASPMAGKPSGLLIAAMVFAGILFLGIFDDSLQNDEAIGLAMLCVLPIAAGAVNLYQKQPGQGISITTIVLASISLLVYLGSIH